MLRKAYQTLLRGARGRMASTKAAFPSGGQSHGAHPNVLQKEDIRKKFFNYRANPEVLPLVGAVSFACFMAVWKLTGSDAQAPDTTWSPDQRRSLEKRLLDRDTDAVESWTKNSWHVGPWQRPREILGIKPSDPKLDY